MAIKDINLSSYPDGGGLVVAVTQDAVNDAMDNFLQKKRGSKDRQFSFFRVFNPEYRRGSDLDQYLFPNEDEVLNYTDNIDPFTKNTEEQARLEDSDFDLAIKGTLGAVRGRGTPETIIFKTREQSSVIFRLGFSALEVAQIKAISRKESEYTYFKQQKSAPFYLEYNVNLEEVKQDMPMQELDGDAQQNIREVSGGALDPDTMFSVQQLYLDLINATELSHGAIPEGFDAQDFDELRQVITKVFFDSLAENGRFLLQKTILPTKKNRNLSPPSFQPVHRLHSITPYKAPDQSIDDANRSSSTLNYQLSADPNKAPLLTTYPWNWMSKTEADKAAGVMVIANDIIADYLIELIEPQIQSLGLEPVPRLQWGAAKAAITSTVRSKASNKKFERKGNSWVFEDQQSKSDESGKINKEYLTVKTLVRATLEFTRKAIVINLKVQAHVKYVLDFTMAPKETPINKNVIDESKTIRFYVGTDGAAGKLRISGDEPALGAGRGITDFFNDIGKFFYDLEAEMRALKALENKVEEVKSHVSEFDEQLLRAFNLSPWVYPGGNTFSFARVQFSNKGDLVASINYTT